jgi:hypothetical protein
MPEIYAKRHGMIIIIANRDHNASVNGQYSVGRPSCLDEHPSHQTPVFARHRAACKFGVVIHGRLLEKMLRTIKLYALSCFTSHMSQYVAICHNMSRFVTICRDLS